MDVRDAIDQLSANAAAGPDGMPAILLNKLEITSVNPSPFSGPNPLTLEGAQTLSH